MCLLVLAWRAHPRYRLVVAANRDEFHERPAAALARWPPPADILAGRDLRAGGTWLGLDRQRRFGVVTNFRELQRPQPGAPSRGELIPRFLAAAQGPGEFFACLRAAGAELLGLQPAARRPGVPLVRLQPRDALCAPPCPRGSTGSRTSSSIRPGRNSSGCGAQFRRWLAADASGTDGLMALLNDRTRVADDSLLPDTGITREWERILSAPFVQHPDYGTRSSTVLLLQADGALQLTERRFDPVRCARRGKPIHAACGRVALSQVPQTVLPAPDTGGTVASGYRRKALEFREFLQAQV